MCVHANDAHQRALAFEKHCAEHTEWHKSLLPRAVPFPLEAHECSEPVLRRLAELLRELHLIAGQSGIKETTAEQARALDAQRPTFFQAEHLPEQLRRRAAACQIRLR